MPRTTRRNLWVANVSTTSIYVSWDLRWWKKMVDKFEYVWSYIGNFQSVRFWHREWRVSLSKNSNWSFIEFLAMPLVLSRNWSLFETVIKKTEEGTHIDELKNRSCTPIHTWKHLKTIFSAVWEPNRDEGKQTIEVKVETACSIAENQICEKISTKKISGWNINICNEVCTGSTIVFMDIVIQLTFRGSG